MPPKRHQFFISHRYLLLCTWDNGRIAAAFDTAFNFDLAMQKVTQAYGFLFYISLPRLVHYSLLWHPQKIPLMKLMLLYRNYAQ